MPWLSKRGHLNPLILETLDAERIDRLRAIYRVLRGNEALLGAKTRGKDPSPDFILRERALIVEVDETQHFTSDRLTTFGRYLSDEDLAYDLEAYKRVLQRWKAKGDGYRAAKPAADFPWLGGRRAQRAYYDSLRDIAAPSFGWRVCRVPAPECNAAQAVDRLVDVLRKLA